jgi:hypothetical protein
MNEMNDNGEQRGKQLKSQEEEDRFWTKTAQPQTHPRDSAFEIRIFREGYVVG